ncbi:hypothetical protein P245_14245 [Comamonas thiooxydans]|uniref:Uncharacterized protein n=1 Tax=Comamonas thiooxydans TaxID=363952 RepID=A0A0E3C1I4_9BURK|nr:hypothetical protein P245_14245 [Comamonas thiooxydans]
MTGDSRGPALEETKKASEMFRMNLEKRLQDGFFIIMKI